MVCWDGIGWFVGEDVGGFVGSVLGFIGGFVGCPDRHRGKIYMMDVMRWG